MASEIEQRKRETEEKIRLAAIRVAQDLAERTFPSPMAIGLAVAAMRFDISRVFITAGGVYERIKNAQSEREASAFYSAYKRGDFPLALGRLKRSGILSGITIGRLDPRLHESSRNQKNGRVEIPEPLQIVTKDELAAYVKKQIAKLGKTSSGWNACASQLGGSESETRWKGTGIHGADGGSVATENSGEAIVFTLTNLRPLARKHLSPGQKASVMKRGQQYLKQLLTES